MEAAMGIVRAETLLRIKKGIAEGIPRTRLYWELRAVGPVTRKTDFFADYRREAKAKKVEGLLRFVRKDRYPSEKIMAGCLQQQVENFCINVKLSQLLG